MSSVLSLPYGHDLPYSNRRKLATWLLFVAGLVFCMVVLGGVTRLTESGLSMVEWKPVTGWLPPLSEEAWVAEFDKYKAFPEYQKVNKGMSLDEFKSIFAFEYAHRVLGRLIGLAFFLPMMFFIFTKKVERQHIPRLVGLLILGGAQGVMGWVMVKSGLVDHPDVSHYRLTAHLTLACLIFAALLWTALDLLKSPERFAGTHPLRSFAVFGLLLVLLQIMIGGFVAGLNAGFIYNNWPMMGDSFIPDDIWHMTPWYLNFFENIATIQFTHRMVAYVIFGVLLVLFLKVRAANPTPEAKSAAHMLIAAVFLQILIGIWTLVAVVPIALGALHQAGGLVVLGASVLLLHRLSR